jgi:Mn-containing catalase
MNYTYQSFNFRNRQGVQDSMGKPWNGDFVNAT